MNRGEPMEDGKKGTTPGPWSVYERKPKDMGPRDMRFHIGNDDIEHTVAEAHEEANARLIAAAPALVEALEGLVEHAEAAVEWAQADECCPQEPANSWSHDALPLIAAARSALAAARGRGE